jgi:hypothetical protein
MSLRTTSAVAAGSAVELSVRMQTDAVSKRAFAIYLLGALCKVTPSACQL